MNKLKVILIIVSRLLEMEKCIVKPKPKPKVPFKWSFSIYHSAFYTACRKLPIGSSKNIIETNWIPIDCYRVVF